MKRPIVIANWKMNLSLQEREELAQDLKSKVGKKASVDVVICPSAISLMQIGKVISGSQLILGAQDVFWEETGAYTGEVSPEVLHELDCRYAIVGHSERRQYLGETDEMVNKKIDACIENDIIPIFCVGETVGQRHGGETDNVILSQVKKGLEKIDIVGDEKLVIAYEPIWAIGSGQAVEPEEAAHVFELINQVITDTYPLTIVKNNVRMIYGGSIDEKNAKGFLKLDNLSGFLIGGASLDADKFNKIIKLI